ncbi:MAG: cupin domain-containing protein, partial [Candidatus Heimdallarchaeota archaeon]
IKGDKVPWHNHENDDELFYVVDGSLLLEIENQDDIIMNTGDLFVVKRGVNHRVSSTEECHIMLIENKSTEHTGKVQSEITKTVEEQL